MGFGDNFFFSISFYIIFIKDKNSKFYLQLHVAIVSRHDIQIQGFVVKKKLLYQQAAIRVLLLLSLRIIFTSVTRLVFKFTLILSRNYK